MGLKPDLKLGLDLVRFLRQDSFSHTSKLMELFELGSELGSEMELGSEIVEWKLELKLGFEMKTGLETGSKLETGLWDGNWILDCLD
jgi:hypothetical protein